MLKTRPQLLEFILNMLSNPWFSSIMSWEGINGQFTIIRPEQAAHLWGDRNGRRNMTYQKFSRALRYYYHKKVLTKIRGQNYTYKFDFQQLERHYGYRGRSSVTFHQPTANSQYMIPSFAACNCDAFPVSHPTKRLFPQFSTTVWTCRKRIRQIELFATVNRYTFSASSARFIKSILDKVCLWTEWTFPFGADSLFSSAHCAPDENDRPSDHEQTLNL